MTEKLTQGRKYIIGKEVMIYYGTDSEDYDMFVNWSKRQNIKIIYRDKKDNYYPPALITPDETEVSDTLYTSLFKFLTNWREKENDSK